MQFSACRLVWCWVRSRAWTGNGWSHIVCVVAYMAFSRWLVPSCKSLLLQHVMWLPDVVTCLQNFGQQSTYNSSSNQPSYGGPDAGPGIDQSLSAHVPGGQGVSTASEQVMLFLLLTVQYIHPQMRLAVCSSMLRAGLWTCGGLWHRLVWVWHWPEGY